MKRKKKKKENDSTKECTIARWKILGRLHYHTDFAPTQNNHIQRGKRDTRKHKLNRERYASALVGQARA